MLLPMFWLRILLLLETAVELLFYWHACNCYCRFVGAMEEPLNVICCYCEEPVLWRNCYPELN